MKEIKNCLDKFVCALDEETGMLQNKYKKQTITTYLPIGSSTEIIRENVVTIITRTTEKEYKISSYEISA